MYKYLRSAECLLSKGEPAASCAWASGYIWLYWKSIRAAAK